MNRIWTKRLRIISLAVFSVAGGYMCWAQPPEGRAGGRGPGGRGFPPMPLMTAIDKNSDGELSADEIESAPKSLMTLDKDKNGKISSEELRPAFGPGGPGGFGGGPDMSADLVQRMLAFDKNGDGKLSAGELPERMKTLMERADTNKDGFLDRTELTAQARRPGPGNPEGRRGIGPESKDRDREGGDRGESKERSRPSTTSE